MKVQKDMRSFLAELTQATDIPHMRVTRRVDLRHELSEIVKSSESLGNPVFRFDDVAGSDLPVVAGLFACRKRVALGLGVAADHAVAHYLNALVNPVPTRPATDAPVREVIQRGAEVDLLDLPVPTHTLGDSGPYITGGVGMARDPVSGAVNTGMYRLRVAGRDRLTVGADPEHDLGRFIAQARAEGRKLDFAVVIGHHPAFVLASQADVPVSVDSLAVTGALLGAPLEVVPGLTVDLPIPARAEIVIEGVIDPSEMDVDGPFAEFTYHYGTGRAPVCNVTAITRRRDAIFLDIHNAHVEHRCLFIFPGSEARLLDRVRQAVDCPVKAVRIPFAAAGLHAHIVLDNPTPEQAHAALRAALLHENLLIKHAVCVDDDIDPDDPEQMAWALATRFQADRDMQLIPAQEGLGVDPSAWRADGTRHTTKMGLDATMGARRAEFPRGDRLSNGAAPTLSQETQA